MTIDENIKRAEEDAMHAEFDSDWGVGNYFIDQAEAMEYAENCRQLAEWLKDYKRLLERESCKDAISRDNAIEAVRGLCDKSAGIFEENPHVDAVLEVLENLPSVKSVSCIAQFRFDEDKLKEIVGGLYCPNCGAKMIEPQESEDKE